MNNKTPWLILAYMGLPAGALAQIQPNQLDLPLVSVGNKITHPWDALRDDYQITIPPEMEGQPLTIEIYSPGLNKNDYNPQRTRTPKQLGDENYSKTEAALTTFTLLGLNQTAIQQKAFTTAEGHLWVPFYQGMLQAGTYTLSVNTRGNAKNSFKLRVTPGIQVSTPQVSINAPSLPGVPQRVGRFTVEKTDQGATLKVSNYDADGSMSELYLQGPQGERIPLTSSPSRQWAEDTVALGSNSAGEWQLFYVSHSTAQFSNALRISLHIQPDARQAKEEHVLPQCSSLLRMNTLKTTPTSWITPKVQCTPTPTEVTAPITLKSSEAQHTTLEFTVDGHLRAQWLTPPSPQSTTAELGITLTTPHLYELPFKAHLQLPAGWHTEDPTLEGIVGGSQALQKTFTIRSELPQEIFGQSTPTPMLTLQDQHQQNHPLLVTAYTPLKVDAQLEKPIKPSQPAIPIKHLVPLHLPETPIHLKKGEQQQVNTEVTTTSKLPTPVAIKVSLPEGLTASGPQEFKGVIQQGKPLKIQLGVTAQQNIQSKAFLQPTSELHTVKRQVIGISQIVPGGHITTSKEMHLDVPDHSEQLILTETLPHGANYATESTIVDGIPAAEPEQVGKKLIWKIPVQDKSNIQVQYQIDHKRYTDVAHQLPAVATLTGTDLQVLQGNPALVQQALEDLKTPTPQVEVHPTPLEETPPPALQHIEQQEDDESWTYSPVTHSKTYGVTMGATQPRTTHDPR
ncbi:hypothetical protein [Deinococcus roseus]|uniref:DUF11 domain-containing protein n=1 Tax=Deinococcus roseus TaxID=392414 RepID=A0ABQ2D3C6_9DEIO|nr:hypothetical protein [Deinococcus roseus]GGJ44434.1 hypothetical protein GCM10008938_33310 [Deinococcus roseus]